MIRDLFNIMLNDYIDNEANKRASKMLEPLMNDIISLVSNSTNDRELEFKLVQIKASLVNRIKGEENILKTLKNIFDEVKEGLEKSYSEHRSKWVALEDRYDLGYINSLEDERLILGNILNILEKYEKGERK